MRKCIRCDVEMLEDYDVKVGNCETRDARSQT